MLDIVCAWGCEYARAIRRPIPALAAEVDDEVVRRVALLPRGESASGRLRARAQEREQRSERVCGGESEGEGVPKLLLSGLGGSGLSGRSG